MALFLVMLVVILIFIAIFVHPRDVNDPHGEATEVEATVYLESGSYYCMVGKYDEKDGVAFGRYTDSYLQKGWDILDLKMNKNKFTDTEKYYSMGVLESCLTHRRMETHLVNMKSWMLKDYGGKIPQYMHDFYVSQHEYMIEEIKKSPTEQFWMTANNLLYQLYGLIDQYNVKMGINMSYVDFQVMASFGDMFSLQDLKKEYRPKQRTTHCTAGMKLMYDLSDIFVGHNSWFHYPGMTRIFKTYDYNVNTISMSSYPGTLCSQDDFYITNDLYIMETTFEIYNPELLTKIVPESVFTWQRSMIANILVTNGEEWAQTFSKSNSGTYNNMWMIVDYKKFVPYEHLKPGLFIILEQLPGYIKYEDMTNVLSLGYWPSYNAPFFEETYLLSGYDTLNNDSSSEYFYIWGAQTAVRFKMFLRDISSVKSIDDFKHLLRYSEWKNDPLSQNDPGFTIAPRFDLRITNTSTIDTEEEEGKKTQKKEPGCWGNFDAKVTSLKRLMEGKGKREVFIVSGPPNNEVDCPVFDWKNSESCKMYTHDGMPDSWDFDWMSYDV